MNQQEQTGAPQAPAWQCSNPACQTTFATPVQQCLTCGALPKGALLSERFRIEALLGRGGMGAVYRASDLALGRLVALKVLAPNAGLAGDAPKELRARFFREARLAAQLDHPNIVPVLHFDIDGPLAYLVMPLLTGGTLGRRMRPKQPADPVVAAAWLHQIAAALDFAHQRPQPIVHRDVKPSNLLFHEDGRLCLADFGIARVVAGSESGEAAHLTRTGIVMGSLSYMAPEQINGHAVPASDQYSAGVLLYELLVGALPFEASDSYGLIIQQVSATPPLPSEHAPGLPRGVDAVVMRALEKQPEERFPTVGALAEAFEATLSGAPTAQSVRSARARVTLPVAPPPPFERDDEQDDDHPFADDLRGELPTQAATILRAAPGGWGAPPYQPPGPPRRRNWWIPALFIGLVAMLVCVVALAGLSRLGQGANTRISQTNTATAQSPTPTATPTDAERYTRLLAAAESNDPILQQSLHRNDHKGWHVSSPGSFANDGLRLPTRALFKRDNNNNTVPATTEQRLAFCAVEVTISVSSASVIYGLGFFPPNAAGYALLLNAAGGYAVMVADPNNTSQAQDETPDARLALTPDAPAALEVIIQGNQFAIFLDHTFIAIAPFSPDYSDASVFALFSVVRNDLPPATVLFSNLTIYPLS
ncbi:MAG TPA: serine/threonine-protein kinase [Ktedonobacterales bacterium]|jgi:serine/threonine-protein kinase